jgi:LysM repeat protein
METYKVKPGDSLARIAVRFGISLGDVLKANRTLRNPNLIFPGQMINLPTDARHPKPDSSEQGPTIGEVFSGALSTSGDPASDPKYIQNAIAAVGLPIWGGPFYLYQRVVSGRGSDAVVMDRRNVVLANDPLKAQSFELRVVYGSRADAEAAATKAVAAYQMAGTYAYYRTAEGLIYPTIISDSTAPALCDAMRKAVEQEKVDARAAEQLSKDLLLWYVGARLPIKTGGGAPAAADAALVGFNAAERGIIVEVRAVLKAPEMAQIREAYALGRDVTVKIGGRVIQYEPALNASGMTMFGENGFLIGRQAFTSEAELIKTLLHETYRLTTSAIGRGAAASAAAIKLETEAAFTFAERAYQAVVAGL